MGMTIDKAIDIMENYEEYGFLSQENGRNKAIDTMRKYQKIEEIIKFGNANELGFEYVGEKITEVMEDGWINI